MADRAAVAGWSLPDDAARTTQPARHAGIVRITHWVIALATFALLLSGFSIVISHPRFYWGEDGNVNTPALFQLPIPASRSGVKTGYDFVLPDQNGWSRSLHFQSAWAAVLAGSVYVVWGLFSGHFRRKLLPEKGSLRWPELSQVLAHHLRFQRPNPAEAWHYNVLQRIAYLSVNFVLFPLAIWTGLAMSPAVVSAFPRAMTVFGGHQSARTIHFFVALLLLLFLAVHVTMVWRAGFVSRTRAMLTGSVRPQKEEPR